MRQNLFTCERRSNIISDDNTCVYFKIYIIYCINSKLLRICLLHCTI